MGWVSNHSEPPYPLSIFLNRYPINGATWSFEQDMGDCTRLLSRFHEDCIAEGLETDTDQPILLDEAVNGGWLSTM